MNELLVDIINSVISAYTVNLKKNNLKLSLANSIFKMTDLELYKYAFLQHDLPLIVEKGVIRDITAHIPWTSFMTEPLEVDINDVQIVLSTLIWEDSKMPDRNVMQDIREHQLLSHEQYEAKAKLLLMLISPSLLKSLLLKFVKSMRININRINIRVLFGDFAVGVNIESIKVGDPKDKTDKITRDVQINGIKVYIDNDQKEKINIEKMPIFFQQMMNYYNMEHSYVVKDLFVEGTALIEDKLSINIDICEINMNIKEWQIEFILRVLSCVPKFFAFFSTKHLVHPEKSDNKGLWNFVHNAAININSPKSFLQRIKEYKTYIKNYKGQDKRNTEIMKLDHSLDYYTVILYRNIATDNKSKTNNLLSIKQLETCIGFCDYDGQVFLSELLLSSPMKVNIGQVNLFIESILVVICQPYLSFNPISRGAVVDLKFSSFQIKQKIKNIYKPVLESIESGRNDFEVKGLFFTRDSENNNEINVSLSATDYVLNLGFMETMKIDPAIFSALKRLLLITQSLRLPPIKISVYASKSSTVIHSGGDVHLVFSLNALVLLLNKETTNFDLANGKITFGDDKEILLADKIDVNGVFSNNTLDIKMNPPTIFCDVVEIPKLLLLFPKSTIFNDIPIKELRELVPLVPSFIVRLTVPEFDIDVKVPLTTNIAKAHIKPIYLVTNVADVKNAAKVQIKLEFNGVSLDADLFDKL